MIIPGFPVLEGEQWKLSTGARYTYAVSTMGRVAKMRNGASIGSLRLCHAVVGSKGYLRVDGIRVHRMVAETFLGYSDLQVNHRNGNKVDNRLENLEYVTCAENIHHAIRVLGIPYGGDFREARKERAGADEDLYMTSEVAAMIGTSNSYIREILQTRIDLRPARKVGRVWLWTQAEIDALRTRSGSNGQSRRRKVVEHA